MKQMKKEIKKRFLAGIKFVIIVGLLLLSLSYAGFFNWAKLFEERTILLPRLWLKHQPRKLILQIA